MNAFTASTKWVHNFKKRHRIVSRKVTKVLSHKQASPAEIQNVSESINNFQMSFKQTVRNHNSNFVFNTDQTSCQLELLSKRTLEVAGTSKIMSKVRSKHSTSHSYTLQFMISKSGNLFAPFLLIFQETAGVFGPNVTRDLLKVKHKEVHFVASKSGKISNVLLENWFLNIYFKHSGNNSVLLLDSLTTYRNRQSIDAQKPRNQKYQVITIPPGLTGDVQPLDVGFNCEYKTFLRTISDYINIYREDIKLYKREAIIQCNVQVHNQFRSPRFKKFIRNSWRIAKLLDDDEFPEDLNSWFDDPRSFCFNANNILNNKCTFCPQKPSFIRCAWCKYYFCFTHFYLHGECGFHFCENYIE